MDKDLVTKGIQMVHDGNYWEAIEILLEELPNDNSEGKIASFIALSYYYLIGKGCQDSWEKAIVYAEQAEKKENALATNILGRIYDPEQDDSVPGDIKSYEKAIYYYKKSISYSKDDEDFNVTFLNIAEDAYALVEQGKIEYLKDALLFARKVVIKDEPTAYSRAMGVLWKIYDPYNDNEELASFQSIDKATYYLDKYIRYYEGRSLWLSAISSLFITYVDELIERGNINYLSSAIRYAENIELTEEMTVTADALCILGRIYDPNTYNNVPEQFKQREKAISYYKKYIQYVKKENVQEDVFQLINNIAFSLIEHERFECLSDAVDCSKELVEKYEYIPSALFLAFVFDPNIYENVPEEFKDYERASFYYIYLIENSGLDKGRSLFFSSLANIYWKQKNDDFIAACLIKLAYALEHDDELKIIYLQYRDGLSLREKQHLKFIQDYEDVKVLIIGNTEQLEEYDIEQDFLPIRKEPQEKSKESINGDNKEEEIQDISHIQKIVTEQSRNSIYEDRKESENLKAIYGKLNSLVGLDSIKVDVVKMVNFVKMQTRRKQIGLKQIPISLHMVFSGNPGTGKTTIARILGEVYKDVGVLSKGHVVEVDRSGLVGEYIGHTAVKTQEKINEAIGGILFIDEAYSLVKEGRDFGQEAIDTLLKAMEDNRNNFIVIVAGYTELMQKFIDSNPGLKSRFTKYVNFPDYSADELVQIFLKMCEEYDFKLTDQAEKVMRDKIYAMEATKDKNFANARDVRNLFEEVVTRQASRLVNEPSADILEIIATDFE